MASGEDTLRQPPNTLDSRPDCLDQRCSLRKVVRGYAPYYDNGPPIRKTYCASPVSRIWRTRLFELRATCQNLQPICRRHIFSFGPNTF